MSRKLYLQLLLLTVFPGLTSNAWTDDFVVKLSRQHIDNLGINLSHLQSASYVPLFSAPAKVVVPPAHEFVISAVQAGLVVKMNASEGDKVNKGDVLGAINSPGLLTLQGNYLKAVSAVRLAKTTYERDKKLRKEGVVSGRSEQESYAAFQAAEIEATEARQLLQISGMSNDAIKQLYTGNRLSSQINIRSPVTGRVIERMAVTGSHVDNLSPLYRIANLDELWLEINIPQEHIADLKVGDAVKVENGLASAVIQVIGQSVNPENQTVLARALIKDNLNTVRAGQKVTIQVVQESGQITYKLPDSAIVSNEGKSYVFVKTAAGFKVTPVTVMGKQNDGTVISGNFSGDEEIAMNNAVTLKANWLGLGSDE